MLNWARVEELREEVGPDAFGEVVELFLEEVTEALTRLDPGAASLEADLHFLKGAALNLGFDGFAGLCRGGETAVRDGRPVDIASLRASYDQSLAAFLDRGRDAGFLAA